MKRFTVLTAVALLWLGPAFARADGTPNDDGRQSQATEELQRALREGSRWVKVHAAESLLGLSLGDAVLPAFERELKENGEVPVYRIGIWRVLAKAAPQEAERARYVEKIRAAGLDPKGPDVIHALEALAKLQVRQSPEDRTRVKALADARGGNAIPYSRWLLAVEGNPADIQSLTQLLNSNDAATRGNAAYALRHLKKFLPDEVTDKLAERARSEPTSPARVNLISAAYVTATQADRRDEFRALLLPCLRTGDDADKCEAAAALAVVGDESDLPALESALADSEADVRVTAANAALRIARRKPVSFALLDWLIVIAYGVGMLMIGWWYSRVKSVEDYLLGGRAMSPLAVGISLFATLMSTLTYLAVPGETIAHGPMILAGLLSYPFVYLVVGKFMIPYIMKLRVVSAYEILERRFGLSVRMAGSSIFLAMRLFWMSLIVFATADIILVPLMGLDPSLTPWVCAVMAVVTIVYTSMGGLQAVVFIDVLQTAIMLAGALISLAIVTYALGGVGAWWPQTWSPYWDKPNLFFAPDSRVPAGVLILSVFTWYTCTAGSDQMAIQRYLATRDAPAARRMFGYSLWCDMFVTGLLAMLGLALLAFFSSHPELLADGETIHGNADRLLPQFIVRVLPAGIAGLVVAGILSAAMDSLSSGLNSATSVIAEDWLDRFRNKRLTASGELRQAKLVSWLVGIAVIILSLLASYVPGNLLEMCYKFVNLLTTPLFILFFMAMFVPWGTTFGVWIAFFATTTVAVGIAYFRWFGLSFPWIMPTSLLAGIVAGCAASLLPIGGRRPMLETAENIDSSSAGSGVA